MNVSGFIDESGKADTSKVISIGCVASYNNHFDDFVQGWGRLLALNGLKEFHANKAFQHYKPLSKRVDAIGVQSRIDALMPFVLCIRKHLQFAAGCVVDVRAFKKLPKMFFKGYGEDPCYMAFVRTVLYMCDYMPDRDKAVLVCDEDEKTTLPLYLHYRKIKKELPDVRQKLKAISFCESEHLFGIQAADLVASLVRLDGQRRLAREHYDFRALFDALNAIPERHERFWGCGIATANKRTINEIARTTLEDMKRRKLL